MRDWWTFCRRVLGPVVGGVIYYVGLMLDARDAAALGFSGYEWQALGAAAFFFSIVFLLWKQGVLTDEKREQCSAPR